MIHKHIFRVIGILLALCILFPTNVYAESYIAVATNDPSLSDTDVEIEELIDKRANILNRIFSFGEQEVPNKLINELNDLDLSLAQHGMTFLTTEEVRTQFPDTKNNENLSLSGQTVQPQNSTTNQPRVSVPDSDLNTWISGRANYTKDGITYNIQRLTAQPSHANSPLANAGSKTITFSQNWKAGTANVIKSVAKSLLEGVVGNISGASIVLSFFDAVSAFVSGISTTTEVDVPNIAYSWSSTTTAVFAYVRTSGQSDDYQRLSMVSTKTQMEVGYMIARFNYTNSNGTSVLSPQIEQGTRSISARPTNYNSSALAVEAYNTVADDPIQNVVNYIQISGPENKQVVKISPCAPLFPLHCEAG